MAKEINMNGASNMDSASEERQRSRFIVDTEGTLGLEDFVSIIARLRAPDGCPWDREQTHQSLKKNLLEECYEVLDAIDDGSSAKLCDELGDVLLQVVFHAQIASEEGRFSLRDVIDGVGRKMIRRHPHVFAESSAQTSEEVLNQWELIKADEKTAAGEHKKRIMEVNDNLPALLLTQKVQDKASRVGFDWTELAAVREKVTEELCELDAAVTAAQQDEELGDLLFSIVNLSRFLQLDAESALRGSIKKFISRFDYMESALEKSNRGWSDCQLSELDELWEQAKTREK